MNRTLMIGLALSALAPSCSSGQKTGFVSLYGQFSDEAPAPAEIRIMPASAMADFTAPEAADQQGDAQENSFVSVFPADLGSFESPRIPAKVRPGQRRPEPPTFFLSFANERDVLYAVGEVAGAFQYRAYDAATKREVDRSELCWLIHRGAYHSPSKGETQMVLAVTPNLEAYKPCTEMAPILPLLERLETMSEN